MESPEEEGIYLGAANLSSADTIKKFQEKEKSRKHLYLVQEIQNESYDVKKFIVFVIQDDPEFDIDSYTLEELKQYVEDFKILNLPLKEAPESNKFDFSDQHNLKNTFSTLSSSQVTQPIDESSLMLEPLENLLLRSSSQSFPLYAKTNTIEKGPLNNNTVKCKLFEIGIINNNSVLLKEKIYIRIKTELKECEETYELKRTLEEFQLLRQVLKKKYPYYIIPPLPAVLKPRKLESLQLRCQKFVDALLRSEVFKADQEVYIFLTIFESNVRLLKEKLKLKQNDLGLFNIYTTDGTVKIQTDVLTAIYASKFPEFLQTYKNVYDNMVKAMREVRNQTRVLGFLYKIISDVLIRLEKIQKEALDIKEDYHLEDVGKGVGDIAAYFHGMGDIFYHHLKRRMEYTSDLGCISYQELWESRQHFKDRYLKVLDILDQKKYKLFQKGRIETWGIKDQEFVEQHREQLLADFDFATVHMLHDETEELERLRQVFQYFTNQVGFEVSREQDFESGVQSANMLEMANAMVMLENPMITEWSNVVHKH